MEAQKLGYEDLKDILALGLAVKSDVVAALADDGKITIGDLPKFIDIVPKSAAAINGLVNVPAQIADIDSAEIEQLHAWVKEAYGVGDEHVKELVADCLDLGLKLASVVLKWTRKTEPVV